MSVYDYKEEAKRRKELVAKFKRRHRRNVAFKKALSDIAKIGGAVLAVVAVVALAVALILRHPWTKARSGEDVAKEVIVSEVTEHEEIIETGPVAVGDVLFARGYEAFPTESTTEIPEVEAAVAETLDTEEYVDSDYAILVNENTGEIVAQKDAYKIINPASMTKILTVLVAAEHLTEEDLDNKFKMTIEIADYVYQNDCSAVNFSVGEKVPVRDLFYGTILPSGADAAIALAEYVAGSQEAFVELMNEKLEELGLSDTAHFTNCIGLYDENHFCSVYDMAMILKAAVENDFCRDVLSAHTYTTTKTRKHKEGITISNWFLRRIEDHPCGGLVLCAKTGYVNESGNCAASYEISDNGTPYICVTAKAQGNWRCIFDHVVIYTKYAVN